MEQNNETTGQITGVTLNEDYSTAAEELGTNGWILPMDSPIYTPVEIYEHPKEINSIMMDYYQNDIRLSNMVCDLIALNISKKHRPVILQSYCAYKMNLFSVCISSLNPLYEGFLSELLPNEDRTKTSSKAILCHIKSQYFNDKNKSAASQVQKLIYINLEAFFKNYSKKTSFSETQNEYTRHNIAHGRISINDDQLEVVKMFSNLYNIGIIFSDKIIESK